MSEVTIENVSDTALWVAAFRAIESERPDALFRDPLASKLAGEKGRALTRAMPYGHMTGWMMVVRTVAIDQLVKDALAMGVDSVINLGAGLDTRPYRLDLPSDLPWVEVDFPHIVQLKNERLVDEKPKAKLTRIGCDLSDRRAAQKLYAELGAKTKKALVMTEGVIAYLKVEQAEELADDLGNIPSFRYWIQDYRNHNPKMRQPKKFRDRMAKAPLQFEHPDPLTLFAGHRWSLVKKISALDEGLRLGRNIPLKFPWNIFVKLTSASKVAAFRAALGFALLKNDRAN